MTADLGGAIAQITLGMSESRLENILRDLGDQSDLNRFIDPLFWFLLTDDQRRHVSVFYSEALDQTGRYPVFSESWMSEQQHRIGSQLREGQYPSPAQVSRCVDF